MVAGISSAGVSFASQSPLVDSLRALKNSLQQSSVLNQDVDVALKSAVNALQDPSSADPMQVAASVMNLLHEVEQHGGADADLVSQITNAVYQIVGSGLDGSSGPSSIDSGVSSLGITSIGTGKSAAPDAPAAASKAPTGTTAGYSRVLTQVNAILGGGIENTGELRDLMMLMDEFPGAFDEGLLDKISEEVTAFVRDQVGEMNSPEELQSFFNTLSQMAAMFENENVTNLMTDIGSDPGINQMISAKFGEQGVNSVNQLMTGAVSAMTSADGSSGTGTGDGPGGWGNVGDNLPDLMMPGTSGDPGVANGADSADIADAIGNVQMAGFAGVQTGVLGQAGLSDAGRIGSISSGADSNRVNSANSANTANNSPKPQSPNATSSDSRPNSNTQRPGVPDNNAATPKAVVRVDNAAAAKLASATVKSNANAASPSAPKPVRVELMGSFLKSDKLAVTKPLDPSKMAKTGGSRSQMTRQKDITNTIMSMAAQAHKSKKDIEMTPGASAGGMADLLRKPKATRRGLAKAFEDDRDVVGEQLYCLFMNVAHFRMEEAMNEIEF